jgi:predicted AAA+ superfamily ATPase
MKTIFKQIISDFHSSPLKEAQPRTLQIPLKTQKIISLIGPRRAGKSFLLFNLMHQLLQSGTLMTDIVYINFEDERILLQGNELQVILDAYFELYPDKDIHQLYFFFDEIHNITGREKFIRRIYDQGMTHIFISGSNAKLLSKEIATSLRGRSLTYELLPLSFKEFLNFKGIQPNLYSTKGKAQLLHLQQTYLLWGGFPEIIDFTDDLKIKTLQEYFDVMLYNDIIERYKIKDTTLLKQFIKLLIQSTTKEYSVNKLGNQFKSKGFKFDKNVLYDFVEYLDTIYFGKSVSKYEYALSKQTLKKIYLFDNGYLNTLSFSFSENF